MHVAIPYQWPHIGASPTDFASVSEIGLHRLGTIGTGSVPLFSYDPAMLYTLIKKLAPDVIDIHEEPYSVSGFEITLMARRVIPNCKLVIYTAQNIRKRYPPPFSWMEKYVMDTVDAAYPCSVGAREVLASKGFRKNVEVIPLPIDVERFAPQSTSNPVTGEFKVGYAGRLEDMKGIAVLLTAVALATKTSSRELLLRVCGAGTEEAAYKRLAGSLGICERVEWIGELAIAKMADFYRTCDCLVVPSLTTSRWKEQFGRTAAEAMACGVPVVVSDSGSLPEVVEDAGIVVPEGDAQALAQVLDKLSADAHQNHILRRRARESAVARFSLESTASMMYSLYSAVLQ